MRRARTCYAAYVPYGGHGGAVAHSCSSQRPEAPRARQRPSLLPARAARGAPGRRNACRGAERRTASRRSMRSSDAAPVDAASPCKAECAERACARFYRDHSNIVVPDRATPPSRRSTRAAADGRAPRAVEQLMGRSRGGGRRGVGYKSRFLVRRALLAGAAAAAAAAAAACAAAAAARAAAAPGAIGAATAAAAARAGERGAELVHRRHERWVVEQLVHLLDRRAATAAAAASGAAAAAGGATRRRWRRRFRRRIGRQSRRRRIASPSRRWRR